MIDVGNPRWKTCGCGCCCHVTTGALVIGIIYAILLVVPFGVLTWYTTLVGEYLGTRHEMAERRAPLIGIIVASYAGQAILLVAVVLLFVGLSKKRAGFLLPFLVLNVIGIAIYVAYMLHDVIVDFIEEGGSAWIVLLVYLLPCLVGLGLNIFFFVVVLRAYQYLRLLQTDGNVGDVAYVVQPTPTVYFNTAGKAV